MELYFPPAVTTRAHAGKMLQYIVSTMQAELTTTNPQTGASPLNVQFEPDYPNRFVRVLGASEAILAQMQALANAFDPTSIPDPVSPRKKLRDDLSAATTLAAAKTAWLLYLDSTE